MTGTPPPAAAYCVSHSAISSSTWSEIAPGAPSSGRSSSVGSRRWSAASWSMNCARDRRAARRRRRSARTGSRRAPVASGTPARRGGRRRARRPAPGCRRAPGTRPPRAAGCRACPTAGRTRGRPAARARASIRRPGRASTAYPARDAPPVRRVDGQVVGPGDVDQPGDERRLEVARRSRLDLVELLRPLAQ